ncbi:hypothetical protein [Profundibacter sp.]|uniref:hypothetical protein n=1 Tax=Profundibacter sp. TaxID=3101071 RepID=UPI003D09AA5A
MANTGNRIDVLLSIPHNAFAKGGFENCAALELNGKVVANSNCVPIEPPKPPATTEYDVTKSCKASGDRRTFSNTGWFQPYQCVITVTTNGVPFTDPLYVLDALTTGGNSQSPASKILHPVIRGSVFKGHMFRQAPQERSLVVGYQVQIFRIVLAARP